MTATRSYTRTLLMCLVLSLASLVLLALLMHPVVAALNVAPLALTLGLGTFVVVVYSLWHVHSTEREAERRKRNAKNNLAAVHACPDYWVATNDGKCGNQYKAPRSGAVFTMEHRPPPLQSACHNKHQLENGATKQTRR